MGACALCTVLAVDIVVVGERHKSFISQPITNLSSYSHICRDKCYLYRE